MSLPLPPVLLRAFSIVQTNLAMISPERVVDYMSNSLALRADHARFFLCILAAYPIAFIYRHFISGLTSRTWRLLYTFITGLLLVFWLVGLDFVHSFITIVTIWLVIKYLHGRTAIAAAFIITLTYLFWGYYMFSLDTEYVICWTMPQCVLTLRLIGLAFDVVDGQRKNISPDQKKTALAHPPTLLETLAYAYFYSGALAGPQVRLLHSSSLSS
jgi:lysophospholipid acyltransferase 5